MTIFERGYDLTRGGSAAPITSVTFAGLPFRSTLEAQSAGVGVSYRFHRHIPGEPGGFGAGVRP
jgi:hypothetical protein